MKKIILAERLKHLRDTRGVSQEKLAELLGLESRQIVSNIETGQRKLSAEELMLCTDIFDVRLDFFTNPYILAGEGMFSWRQNGVDPTELDAFEFMAGEWIGAYRSLRDKLGQNPPALLKEIRLAKNSTFEDAVAAGEAVAHELGLGEVPAAKLMSAAENDLGAIVLMADAQAGVSGAACRLPEMNAIIINRNEPPSRRHYDLAHEIFHLLTWEAMPPERIDGSSPKNKRIEQLADQFASGLLMPSEILQKYAGGPSYDDSGFVGWVNETATELMVSSTAFIWKLVNNKQLNAELAKEILNTDLLSYNGGMMQEKTPPPLFSAKFLRLISEAINKGLVSERRVSTLLKMPLADLAETFNHHKLESPFGL